MGKGGNSSNVIHGAKSSSPSTSPTMKNLHTNKDLQDVSEQSTSTDVTTKRTDFYWSTTDEPHATRRKLILQKYPEIKSLYGYCWTLKYKILANVVLQLILAYTFRNQLSSLSSTTAVVVSSGENDEVDNMHVTKYPWYVFLLTAYIIGGTCNHMCMMGLHELSHNLGFKTMIYNQYYSIFVSNVPIAIPAAISFKRYHMDHHKYQGVDGIDVDIPTTMEGQFFYTIPRKLFFVTFQMLFYAIRPLLVNPKPKSKMELLNIAYTLATDALIVYMWGFSSLLYLLVSTLFGMGLHPCAGHFIAEHFVFPSKEGEDGDYSNSIVPETYSYYGVVNYLTFNVGYHNEHHDFPFIPGSRLPKVKQIAAEFYDPLPHHTSYIQVMYDYITMPSVTAFSRVKRTATIDDPDGVITDQDISSSTTKATKTD